MHVRLKDLPEGLRAFLEGSLSYHRPDVELEEGTEVSGGGCAFEGSRGYVAMFNLGTNDGLVTWGSWGGGNQFESRPADNPNAKIAIPPNIVAITGEVGGRGSFAHLIVNSGTLVKFLPTPPVELDDRETAALWIFMSIKSGYRREEMDRHQVTSAVLDSLVKRGLLKANAAGAKQITTEGKNAFLARYDQRATRPLPKGLY